MYAVLPHYSLLKSINFVLLSLLYQFDVILAIKNKHVSCGTVLKLINTDFKVRLHSHDVKYETGSGQQSITATEVAEYAMEESLFRVDNNEGDSEDHWEVICSGDYWLRDAAVQFRHVDTDFYLAVSGQTFERPINGQMKVVGIGHLSTGSHWKMSEGLFIHPKQGSSPPYSQTEL